MLNLTVVTPKQDFLNTECKSVSVYTENGQIEILEGHANLLSKIVESDAWFVRSDGSKQEFLVKEGILKVLCDKVVLMCDDAHWKHGEAKS